MPNRIIKESICTSCEIDSLQALAETTFYRLIVNCDDYGRMDGRATVLRSKLYPLKLDVITNETIEELIKSLEISKLIERYEIDGKPFIQILSWHKHQNIRAQHSKYPAPNNNGNQPHGDVINGNQMITEDSKSLQTLRNPIQTNPIQSNPMREYRNDKKPYGSENAILLTDSQYEELVKRFGKEGTERRIEDLTVGIMSKGYKYKSHYHTILSWDRMDEKRKPVSVGNGLRRAN